MMFVYRRQRSDSDGKGLWLLGVRALVSVVVLITDWGVLHNPLQLDTLHVLYITFGLLVFLTYAANRRYGFHRLFYLCLSIQLFAELLIVGSIVETSGGLTSPFFALYLLTIVSAALSYRLVGTLLVATAAAISYIGAIYAVGQSPWSVFDSGFWRILAEDSDKNFYAIFLRLCTFYLLAFISGFLAQRLKHQDEALASTSRALQAARMETGDILKHLHSGLLTIDTKGHVTYFNQAAEEILKIQAARVRGRSVQAAFGRRYPALAVQLQLACQSLRGNVRGEIEVETEPGHVVPLGISTSIMGSADSRRGVIAVFQDITDAKQMEERLRLKDRLAAIGELAAGIAHEIRNPLAAISGSVEVLLNELKVHDENRKLLELIVKESCRLNDIITEFLYYSRIRPTVMGRVRIRSVLQDVFEIVNHRMGGGAGIDLHSRLDDPEVLVNADEDHLKQLLLNLVINATEAIGAGPGAVQVLCRDVLGTMLPEPENPPDILDKTPDLDTPHWLCLTVADDGPGIRKEIRKKVWQPFFSTKNSGTGLGLAVVRRLVENLGGQIELESAPEKGTQFHVFLKKHVPRTAQVRLAPRPMIQ